MVLLAFILVGMVFSGCSSNDTFIPEDFSAHARPLITAYTQYASSNPQFVSSIYENFRLDDYSASEYCGYDILFSELAIVDGLLDESCVQAHVIMRSFSPIGEWGLMNLSNYTITDYESIKPYSAVLLYSFDSQSEAERFSLEVYDLVLETYESQYIPMGSLDMPRYVAAPASMEFVGYARAIAPFIEYGDEIGVFHVVVFQRDKFVLVHKVYSDEQRIRVNY